MSSARTSFAEQAWVSGNLIIGSNTVDATSGPASPTLPEPTAIGQFLSVEKVDSSANVVTIAGTIRGKGTSVTLALPNETMLFQAESPISWRPMASHKTLASLDSRFATSAYGGTLAGSDGSALFFPREKQIPWVAPTDLITDFESGHGWTGSAGFNGNDTTDCFNGSQSATITTAGSGSYKIESGTLSIDLTQKQIRIVVKIPDITNVSAMNFWAGNDSSYTNAYKWFVQGTAGGSNLVNSGGVTAQEGWTTVVLNVADATLTGSPTRTGIVKMKFEIISTSAVLPVKLQVDQVDTVAEAVTQLPNGGVVICFDDVLQEGWTNAKPILDTYRFRTSQFVICDQIGQAGRVTFDQLQAMQAQGHEIHAHAFTDADHTLSYTGMTAAALDADLRAMKSYLRSNGFHGDGTAYPLGQYGLTTDNVQTSTIVRKYFSFARSTANGTNKPGATIPIGEPFGIPALSSVTTFSGGFTPTALVGTGVGSLQATAAAHGVKVLTFHKVVTGSPAALTEINVTDFATIMAEINSLGMKVMTFGEYYSLASTPAAAVAYSATEPAADTIVGSAGSATSVARSDHSHKRFNPAPADRNWLGWTLDPDYAAASTALATPGTLYVFRAKCTIGSPINHAPSQLLTLGSVLTASQCFVGVANLAGQLQAQTADQSAIWASPGTTGTKNHDLTAPYTPTADEIEIWVLFNGTTGPTFPRANGNALINLGFTTPRFATADTGRTTLPGTRGALTALSIAYCFGLS